MRTSNINLQWFVTVMACVAIVVAGCAPPTQQDIDKGLRDKWLTQARGGDAEAQYFVAQSYCCGSGGDYSTQESILWYCRSAKQGYVLSQVELGNLYSNSYSIDSKRELASKHLSIDLMKAYMWYTVAAARGNELAFAQRKELGNMMDPQDVVIAKQQATRWKLQNCEADN